MNTRGIPAKRVEEEIVNDEIPLLGPQDGKAPQGNQENEVSVILLDMTN